MNKNLFVFLLLLISPFLKGQSYDDQVQNVEIYFVKWDSRYSVIRNEKNIKYTYLYYFENKDPNLYHFLFEDYTECTELLSNQPLLDSSDRNIINSYVKLIFSDTVVELVFDISGNYYFQDKWYLRNDILYYNLFNYFSDMLIPQELLKKTKRSVDKIRKKYRDLK